MAGHQKDQNQGKPTARPSVSNEERERVTGRQQSSGFEERPRTSGTQMPKQAAVGQAQRASRTGHAAVGGNTQPGNTSSGGHELTNHQKSQLSSAFQDAGKTSRMNAMLGNNTGESKKDSEAGDDEPTALAVVFDGKKAPDELTNKDVWKAVQPPVQSREGRRSKSVLQNVLNQFAVGTNPRYLPDAVDKPRGHIFVWDVSRAMNCEVPHFVGPRELTLSQTVDWLRHEGPMRGWTRAGSGEAHEAAMHGMLAIALPREVKLKHMAIVVPVPADPGLKPRVASASRRIGDNLPLQDGIGAHAAEYFVHL